MDVLRIIKPTIKPLKASYDTLNLKDKIVILIVLVSLVNFIIPHETAAQKMGEPASLVFVLGNHGEYIALLTSQAQEDYYQSQLRKELARKQRLIVQVADYLKQYNSPLAETVPTLVTLKNWKKIVALSNAESSLCRRYPESTANCWGVGGSELWDMGSDLTEGVVAMNHFLENYPRRSTMKYAAMNFDQMNGLYKQPAKEHWVVNNEVVYYDLEQIEGGI